MTEQDADSCTSTHRTRERGSTYWDGSSETHGSTWSCELPAGHEGNHRDSFRAGPPGHRDTEYIFWDGEGNTTSVTG